MDKYLMSSPTQLSQLFVPADSLSRAQMDDESHVPLGADASPGGYEELDFASELPDFSYDQPLEMDPEMRYAPARGHAKHFSVDAPLHTPFAAGARYNFSHSRNVSLDDSSYRPQLTTPARRHAHSLSLTSNSADPPSGTFSHSVSTSTLGSMDSYPQLSSSVSNKSLLDSPYSSMNVHVTTPGRRRLSTSLSSGNLYTTPLRPAHSPMKVGKTHRRNRSRASVEPGSASLLASIANMKHGHAHGGYAHGYPENGPENGHSPFESTLLSPDLAMDDYATPLATPAHPSHGAHPVPALYFTPIAHSASFGGSLHDTSLNSAAHTGHYQLPRVAQPHSDHVPGPYAYRGFEPLEDLEDDACRQLRRAKSFTPNTDPRSMLSQSASVRNVRGGAYAHSPLTGPDGARPFPSSSAIDLLSPDMVGQARNSALKSYPASIDLAAITKSGAATAASSPVPKSGLFPPLPSARSTSSIPTVKTPQSSGTISGTSLGTGLGSSLGSGLGTSLSTNLSTNRATNATNLSTNLATKTTSPTPSFNSSQIQETSATDEIAKFAESILKSDMKRPIVVQEESADAQDPKKKHKCPLCFARFQRPEHVKRHLKSHSSEKPFQCDMEDCGRRFNRKDNLKAHMKKIHGKTC